MEPDSTGVLSSNGFSSLAFIQSSGIPKDCKQHATDSVTSSQPLCDPSQQPKFSFHLSEISFGSFPKHTTFKEAQVLLLKKTKLDTWEAEIRRIAV
jgi:hypothetical protein